MTTTTYGHERLPYSRLWRVIATGAALFATVAVLWFGNHLVVGKSAENTCERSPLNGAGRLSIELAPPEIVCYDDRGRELEGGNRYSYEAMVLVGGALVLDVVALSVVGAVVWRLADDRRHHRDRPPQSGQWAPDPSGRYRYRYFDGTRWTDHVADDGGKAVDPLTSPER